MRVWYLNEIPIKAVWYNHLTHVPTNANAPYVDMEEGVGEDALLQDLQYTIDARDSSGNPKYRIVDVDGVLKIRPTENWTPDLEA